MVVGLVVVLELLLGVSLGLLVLPGGLPLKVVVLKVVGHVVVLKLFFGFGFSSFTLTGFTPAKKDVLGVVGLDEVLKSPVGVQSWYFHEAKGVPGGRRWPRQCSAHHRKRLRWGVTSAGSWPRR